MSIFRYLPIDIETGPMEGFFWSAKTEYISHEFVEQETTVICCSFRDPRDNKIKTFAINPATRRSVRNDKAVCRDIHSLLMYCGEENIVLLYQNGDRFDLPKLKARFIKHGFPPLPKLQTIDTLKAAKRFGFDYNRLDFLDKHLSGIGKVQTRGWSMWKDIVSRHSNPDRRRKALKEMVRYCEGDILALERLYNHLRPYMESHPDLNLYQQTDQCCPSCGKDELQRRSKPYFARSRAYARYSCKACGVWTHLPIVVWKKTPQRQR